MSAISEVDERHGKDLMRKFNDDLKIKKKIFIRSHIICMILSNYSSSFDRILNSPQRKIMTDHSYNLYQNEIIRYDFILSDLIIFHVIQWCDISYFNFILMTMIETGSPIRNDTKVILDIICWDVITHVFSDWS